MKIALVCQSLLLSRSLQSFLKESIVSYKQCDFVISDKKIELDKPIFLLSANDEGHLGIPFSKASLLLALEAFHQTVILPPCTEEKSDVERDFLEEKIASLTEKFRQELIQTLRDYYGN
jgi:hypothetical protein